MDGFLPYLRAFLCGGTFCLIGQILIDRTKLTPAKILVLYVVSGVILGGLGIYQHIVDFGGAGAAEVDDVLVDAQTAQYHPGDHIEHQDLGGGQLGPVDEDLSDEAKGPSAEEGTQIGEKSIHFYTPFSVEMATA